MRADRRANPGLQGEGTALELLVAPRFRTLIEALLAARMPAAPRVLPECTRAGIGRPDLAFARPASRARSFIELKAPGKAIEPGRLRGHDRAQFRRFSELPLWALSNFDSIHLYRRDRLEAEALIVPRAALDPATPDARAERMIRKHPPDGFLAVLDALALAQPAAPRNALELAQTPAHAARLLRGVVADLLREAPIQPLRDVQAEFRETLFAHPKAGGHDDADEAALFANAFAQTLTFGLLLAREASGAEVGQDAHRKLQAGAFPLLRATLRALTLDDILEALGVAFEVACDTVNSFDPALLQRRDGRDPILHFYEDFLAVFDPEARRRHGVFFTPVPVVNFMVSATDRALREGLAEDGLADRSVMVLDPACGIGTFLIAAAPHAIARLAGRFGPGAIGAEMAPLAERLHGFELLVGPDTVAHYRLLHEIAAVAGAMPSTRLPICLADTLAPAAEMAGVTPRLGFLSGPIVEERRAADALKRLTPIIAIIGNPPYRRLDEGEEAGIVSGWDNGFREDLKAPVRNAGWGNELNTFPELSVAFWRWCLWKLFESEGAPRRGVVCLITNRTFLAGHPYAGLRQMLRRRFDRIEILDLRGDLRGAKPAGITQDEGVFDIKTGVCVLTAVATGAPRDAAARARVRYADAWRHGAFTEAEKLAWLEAARAQPARLRFVEPGGGDLDDFVPKGFAGLDWPALSECFAFRNSGVQTKRDALVYANTAIEVEAQVRKLTAADEAAARASFHETRDRKLAAALARGWDAGAVRPAAYRPLDRRVVFAAREFVDFPRPDLLAAWGESNVCLYAMPSGTGAGPALWVHALVPDYHAHSGRGGYAFPLWDRRAGATAHNLAPALLTGLAAAYGMVVAPQTAFDAIIALLSAASYTRRFAWDLEESLAHVPFPAEPAVFLRAAELGAAIRAVETFARPPGEAFRSARLEGRARAPAASRCWRTARCGSPACRSRSGPSRCRATGCCIAG